MRTEGLDQPPAPMVHMPYLSGWGLRFILRSNTTPDVLIPLLRNGGRAENPGVLLQRFRLLSDILDETVRDRMVSGVLVGGFAILGLIISSVGLYGTLAAQVQNRRRKIGIRMALGATVRNVSATVLGDGLRILAFGALAGVAGSLCTARLIQHELYGVSPLDLPSFTLALLLLSTAALAACVVPAIQAADVDPVQALNIQ